MYYYLTQDFTLFCQLQANGKMWNCKFNDSINPSWNSWRRRKNRVYRGLKPGFLAYVKASFHWTTETNVRSRQKLFSLSKRTEINIFFSNMFYILLVVDLAEFKIKCQNRKIYAICTGDPVNQVIMGRFSMVYGLEWWNNTMDNFNCLYNIAKIKYLLTLTR